MCCLIKYQFETIKTDFITTTANFHEDCSQRHVYVIIYYVLVRNLSIVYACNRLISTWVFCFKNKTLWHFDCGTVWISVFHVSNHQPSPALFTSQDNMFGLSVPEVKRNARGRSTLLGLSHSLHCQPVLPACMRTHTWMVFHLKYYVAQQPVGLLAKSKATP